ncbi:MAG: hypothetical protein Q4E61_01105, partial [Alphaproteobacteria bacterium]|nr:hypothetical protein [Alphaproteobacteria bacterium]
DDGSIDQKNERYLVKLNGVEAKVEVFATEECKYCPLKFSFIVPQGVQQDEFSENIIKIIELKDDDVVNISSENPKFISNNKIYWFSTQYLKDKNEKALFHLKWSGLE